MKQFKNILFVADLVSRNSDALERATTLAENNQARLTVVVVTKRITVGIGMPPGGPISEDLQAAMTKKNTLLLEELVAPFRQRVEIEVNELIGVSFMEIIRDVLRNGRDMVIKIPEHITWSDRLFGSNDMHLFRKCPCPLWLIKPQAPKTYRRVLAAVDIHYGYPLEEQESRCALNQRVLEIASSEALAEFAELHIVHVWRAIEEDDMHGVFLHKSENEVVRYVEQVRQQHETGLAQFIDDTDQDMGSNSSAYLLPKIHLLKGWPQEEVPSLAQHIEADLVVMGTVGLIGLPGFFMGNTAEAILSQINCSVLAIKPPGFETPVTLEG